MDSDSVRAVEIEVDTDYHDLPEAIPLCSFTGFTVGSEQRIVIRSPELNGRPIEMTEFADLLRLRVRDNPYIEDHSIDNCHEICFNGELELVVRAHRDRLFWCPAYHSDRRSGFVFNNMLFDQPMESPELRTYRGDRRQKRRVYRNAPHHDHDTQQHYDLAAFGCSVTYGTALSAGEIWPTLVGGRTLNMGLPGVGIDGVFLNLQASLERFRFDRIVLLLPCPHRLVLRLPMPATGGWARVTVSGQSDWHHSAFKRWAWQSMGTLHDPEQIEQWRRLYTQRTWDLVMREDDRVVRYHSRVIDRMTRLCESTGLPYHMASWDEETQHMIQQRVPPQRQLPPFTTHDIARDGLHPGTTSHRLWTQEILPLIQ